MQIVRRAAFAAALVTAAAAVFATVDGTMRSRAAQSSAARERDYAAIGSRARRQLRLLGAEAGKRPDGVRSIDRLNANLDGVFSDLQRRSQGQEKKRAAALAASYRTASQHARAALARDPRAGRVAGARRALAAVSAKATALAATRRDAAVARPGSPATPQTAATALSAFAALVLIACLLALAPRGRRHRAERDHEIEQLEAAAHTDSLTGLGNHRSFHHDLSLAIQARAASGSTFALMAIDLDGLKQINDSKGHPAGDSYIRQITEYLRQATSGEGTVYRTGGDEFMVLLPGRRNWHALATARRIDELTRGAFGRRAVSIGLTESTGVEARHLLVHQADLALYDAKRTKLTAVTFHPGLTKSAEAADDGPSHHQKTLAAALARAVDAKDAGTRSHSETVAELTAAIGARLGISGDRLERLRLAGLLHDVGKIGVPDAILQKAESLAAEEQKEMREHVSIGHAILNAAEMPLEAEWVLHHHERFDGGGYPTGLRGPAIPIESRIIAVADAFETMTATRPYREGITTAVALAELDRHSGSQFDGRCVDALAELVGEAAAEAAVADASAPSDERAATTAAALFQLAVT